jgi:hypothetical protein
MRSVTVSVTGRVPTDERDTKPSWIAGQAMPKKRVMLMPFNVSSVRVQKAQHVRHSMAATV